MSCRTSFQYLDCQCDSQILWFKSESPLHILLTNSCKVSHTLYKHKLQMENQKPLIPLIFLPTMQIKESIINAINSYNSLQRFKFSSDCARLKNYFIHQIIQTFKCPAKRTEWSKSSLTDGFVQSVYLLHLNITIWAINTCVVIVASHSCRADAKRGRHTSFLPPEIARLIQKLQKLPSL